MRLDEMTEMNEGDEIVIRGDDPAAPAAAFQRTDGWRNTRSSSRLSLCDAKARHTPSTLMPFLAAGDLVVRGPCWQYGEEDGGPGSCGIVLKIDLWMDVAGDGVRVRWLGNGVENLYRKVLDVQVLEPMVRTAMHEPGQAVVQGNTVEVEWR